MEFLVFLLFNKFSFSQGVYIKTTINIEKESEEVYNKLKQKSSIFMKSVNNSIWIYYYFFIFEA